MIPIAIPKRSNVLIWVVTNVLWGMEVPGNSLVFKNPLILNIIHQKKKEKKEV